jgi:hypothetical protein
MGEISVKLFHLIHLTDIVVSCYNAVTGVCKHHYVQCGP